MNENTAVIILEEMRSQFKAVLEAVDAMQAQVKYIPAIRSDIAELKSDVKILKASIKDISGITNNHETRIIKLERATQS